MRHQQRSRLLSLPQRPTFAQATGTTMFKHLGSAHHTETAFNVQTTLRLNPMHRLALRKNFHSTVSQRSSIPRALPELIQSKEFPYLAFPDIVARKRKDLLLQVAK